MTLSLSSPPAPPPPPPRKVSKEELALNIVGVSTVYIKQRVMIGDKAKRAGTYGSGAYWYRCGYLASCPQGRGATAGAEEAAKAAAAPGVLVGVPSEGPLVDPECQKTINHKCRKSQFFFAKKVCEIIPTLTT